MTKNDFILQAMLRLAANEKYVDFERGEDGTEFPSLDVECIFIDAEALAGEAEKRMDSPFDEEHQKPSYSGNEHLRNISEHLESMKDDLEEITRLLSERTA